MTPVRRSAALVLAIVLSATLAAAQPTAPPNFDAFVARVMKTFEVPGLSVAIVKGRDTFVKGYGARKIGEPAPVDERTLFGIASNTKVFTAAALGLLVEEGKLRWDGRVIDYLPWFQMYDPYVTRELTIRDLLVHRSGLGLGAGDLLWWPASTYTRRQIAARLRYIKPVAGFRAAYAYDNVLYTVAGEVIEAISGQSWEDFVGARILTKVGMSGSNTKHSDAALAGNVAATHARVDGVVRPIGPFLADNTNPAGGINSSAEDMAKWVRVLLSQGALPDASRLFSEGTWRQLTSLVTPIPIGNVPAELAPVRANFDGYALGLGVRDYRGEKLLTHTGGLPGYLSRVAWIPAKGLGVVVLTNQESGEAFDAIVQHVLDHHLGATDMDWVETYRVLAGRQQEAFDAAEKKAMAARDASSRPSLPLAKYAGKYRDAWYGDVTLTEEKGRLVMRFLATPSLVGTLEHFQHDTFIVRWHDRELRADAYVQFALEPDGSIDRLTMEAVSPLTDFSFDFQDLLLEPVR